MLLATLRNRDGSLVDAALAPTAAEAVDIFADRSLDCRGPIGVDLIVSIGWRRVGFFAVTPDRRPLWIGQSYDLDRREEDFDIPF